MYPAAEIFEQHYLDPRILDGFFVHDVDALATKITAVHDAIAYPPAGEAPMRLELRADFDKTLTVGGRDEPSSWEVMHHALPPKAKKESQAERTENLALQRMGVLSPDEMAEWSMRELGRHVRFGTRTEDIQAISRQMCLREGVKELFDFCADNGIPRHIVSAGAANPILYVLKDEGLAVSEEDIIANMLHADSSGVVTDWDESTLVYPHNKREQIERLRQPVPGQRRCIIAFGDSMEDALMAEDNGSDIIVRVRTGAEDSELAAHLAESWAKDDATHPGFDLVLRGQDLGPLRDLLEVLLTPPSQASVSANAS
jgi:HAD superfamily phosphoserine phosphatase-like hydrolase